MSDLENAKAEILIRANSLNGTYNKADFGLTEYEISTFKGTGNDLRRRANQVDSLILKYIAEGKNVTDPKVLQEIAFTVRSNSVPEKTFLGGLFTIVVILGLIFLLINILS